MRTRIAAGGALAVLALAAAAGTAAGGGATAGSDERPPAVAGRYYPGERAALAAEVGRLLAAAPAPRAGRPLALVAPHAGYVFCGGVLATAWRQAQGRDYDLVVLLGTNHTTAGFGRATLWPAGAFRTPLGAARVDAAAARALLGVSRDCVEERSVHAREHSVEVQVPFAQTVLPGVPILPVIVSSDDPRFCARLGADLAAALRGRRPLIVASSDLSHYPARADAEAVDRATLAAFATLDANGAARTLAGQMARGVAGLGTCACGEGAVLAAMAAAKALGATRGDVLAYANSAGVPEGDPAHVVGYGAVAWYAGAEAPAPAAAGPAAKAAVTPDEAKEVEEAAETLAPGHRRALLSLARATIEAALAGRTPPAPAACEGPLAQRRGAFVTLHLDGRLRGCIGHMAEDLRLCDAVREMALAAAFEDRRFAPVTRGEWPRCAIEISALTVMRPVPGPEAIVVGRDGVVLRKAGRSAVFLPQVATEQGWDRDTLLSELALKAGLPRDAWRSGAQLLVFQAEVFAEAEAR